MHAGREARAARGELAVLLPRGYVQDEQGRAAKDPDAGVRARIDGIFAMFRQHGSLSMALRMMAADGQGFPVRRARGPRRGMPEWPEPGSASLCDMPTSPVHAGAFAWGRARGKVSTLPLEERWRHLVGDSHPGYISREEFELNQRQLADNRWPVRSLGGGMLSGPGVRWIATTAWWRRRWRMSGRPPWPNAGDWAMPATGIATRCRPGSPRKSRI